MAHPVYRLIFVSSSILMHLLKFACRRLTSCLLVLV